MVIKTENLFSIWFPDYQGNEKRNSEKKNKKENEEKRKKIISNQNYSNSLAIK